ncbi:hypothetical protein M8C21_019279 [Ambrosia artemisiifolia]|uniref:Vacuolar fusion protein MON1 homolog n=1 Tax=Ambrosia artemisiifolia TaxID=4212 RepID=A0AAD5DDK5_AMBAR|nr:hypothetical protein M8C21_019279 [Ambrosia artemisiifolia]
MASDSSSIPPLSSEDEEDESSVQKPSSVVNTNNSIDTSLDAIENQLSSISFNTPIDVTPPPAAANYNHEHLTDINDGSLIETDRKTIINIDSVGQSSNMSGLGLWINNTNNNNNIEINEGMLTETGGESSNMKASGVWMNNNNNNNIEVEGEREVESPSSSGYVGERGSSGSVSSASGTDGIREVRDNGDAVGDDDDGVNLVGDSQGEWVRGKRHADEDDASISWRKRKKHFFILSHSGKPIYSRYGDEHKLAGFSATLQAIISFVENGGDCVKLVRAGKHQVIFLVKGPIYLVCISCTEEPYESLRGQLELLYGQMILILTRSVDRCFEKNPKFDMTPLLGGTDAVFSSLIHSFSQNPATFLHAYTCLPLAYATRQAAGAILQDVADTGHLNPFRQYVCQDTTLWHFYMLMFIILMIRIETVLSKSNVLNEVQRSLSEGGLRIDDLPVDPSARSGSLFHLNQRRPPESVVGIGGPAGLLHFIYRSIYLDQYVSSEFASPISTPSQQKRLYRAYQRLYASMHDKGVGPHKTQFRRDENYVLLCWVTQDFELYAAFDPLADKGVAIRICNRVCQWVKDVETEIFLLGASSFSW